MKNVKKRVWFYGAGIIVLLLSLALISIFLFRGLGQTKKQEALLEINSAVTQFSNLKTGVLDLETSSQSDNTADKESNYQEFTHLTFARSEDGYNYLLEQRDKDGALIFQMKEIGGQCFLDQGTGFTPYPKKETSLPAAIGMMLVKPQEEEVDKIKVDVQSDEKEITVYYKLDHAQQDGIKLQKMTRVYHLQQDGLLQKAEEMLEGDVVRDGKRVHLCKTSVARLQESNQEVIIS